MITVTSCGGFCAATWAVARVCPSMLTVLSAVGLSSRATPALMSRVSFDNRSQVIVRVAHLAQLTDGERPSLPLDVSRQRPNVDAAVLVESGASQRILASIR